MNKLNILVYDEEFARLIKHIDTLDSICIHFKFTNEKKVEKEFKQEIERYCLIERHFNRKK